MIYNFIPINKDFARKEGIKEAVLISELITLFDKAEPESCNDIGFLCSMDLLLRTTVLTVHEVIDTLGSLRDKGFIYFGAFFDTTNELEIYFEEDNIAKALNQNGREKR